MARLASLLCLTAASGGWGASLYDLEAVDIDGASVPLSVFRGSEEYAGQPVNFLLFPCNQFGAQEPATNGEIKAFAEKYIDPSAESNIFMFAKSNLNGVPCDAVGKDTCTGASKECCPQNDGVYKYLLGATPPGTIAWNFDKIIVDVNGHPFFNETILHGPDAVNDAIEMANPKLATQSVCRPESSPVNLASGSMLSYVKLGALGLTGLLCGAVIVRLLQAKGVLARVCELNKDGLPDAFHDRYIRVEDGPQ